MRLYHGSNIAIDNINLAMCRPYKDFGQGFYLTDIEEQAEKMAILEYVIQDIVDMISTDHAIRSRLSCSLKFRSNCTDICRPCIRFKIRFTKSDLCG